MKRVNLSSGAVWEDIVGYSRAVKVGNIIEVSGTTSAQDGKIIGVGDPYLQTKFIIEKIEKSLIQLGASLENVIRTRLFVTDINQWNEYGKAHQEFFGKIKPATTMVEVKSLIDPDMLIEIEVTAVI